MSLKNWNLMLMTVILSGSGVSRADIVGGEDVRPTDPVRNSTAALYEPSADGRGGALCTASLISKDVAVTAAHCVTPQGPKPVLIFGDRVRSSDAQARPVTSVRVNPKWRTQAGRGMDQGDIALVKFGGGTPDGYGPVATEQADASLKKGEAVTLAGYGINNARTQAGAGVLRKTQVKISDPRTGKSEMVLDQSHGHGACHGDSGGPAFVREGGKMVLAGVTNRSYPDSAPDDCAHKVVYTKVSAYQPWIRRNEQQMDAGTQSSDYAVHRHDRPTSLAKGRPAKKSAAHFARSGARTASHAAAKRSGGRRPSVRVSHAGNSRRSSHRSSGRHRA